MTGKINRLGPQEKAELKGKKLAKRFKHEAKRLGGYEMIYPCANPVRNQQYDKMLVKANELWDEFTTGKPKNKKKDNHPSQSDLTQSKKDASKTPKPTNVSKISSKDHG